MACLRRPPSPQCLTPPQAAAAPSCRTILGATFRLWACLRGQAFLNAQRAKLAALSRAAEEQSAVTAAVADVRSRMRSIEALTAEVPPPPDTHAAVQSVQRDTASAYIYICILHPHLHCTRLNCSNRAAASNRHRHRHRIAVAVGRALCRSVS